MTTLNDLVFSSKDNFNKMNTLTKYPSIATYHPMGDKGKLQPEVAPNSFADIEEVYITEKIDGTNSRIVYFNGDWIIGSRENLLCAKGDRIGDPSQSIVETVKPLMTRFEDCKKLFNNDTVYVLFGESYGGKITKASREYTKSDITGFRLFDVAAISINEINDLLKKPIENLATWREGSGDGHNRFFSLDGIRKFSNYLDIEEVPTVLITRGREIPKDLEGTYEWLNSKFSTSIAKLDDGPDGLAEGVVVRDFYRKTIRKIRFQDYERTLGLKKTR